MKAIDLYDLTQAFSDCPDRTRHPRLEESTMAVDNVLQLFLGLGYQPITLTTDDLENQRAALVDTVAAATAVSTTEQSSPPQWWTLAHLQRVFDTYPRFAAGSSRTQDLEATFDSIRQASKENDDRRSTAMTTTATTTADDDDDTSFEPLLTASDLVALSQELGDSVDLARAQRMLTAMSGGGDGISSNHNNGIRGGVSRTKFLAFCSPPEP